MGEVLWVIAGLGGAFGFGWAFGFTKGVAESAGELATEKTLRQGLELRLETLEARLRAQRATPLALADADGAGMAIPIDRGDS